MKKFSKPGIGSAKSEMNVIWNCQNWARFAFFLAISTLKLDSKMKKSRTSDKGRETDESNEESAINLLQISTPGKQVFPEISYWVACQTQNGSVENPMKIQRALEKCGLEFYLSRP